MSFPSPTHRISDSHPAASQHAHKDSEYVVALHDYENANTATTCLAFKAGDLIRILNKDKSGWFDGELVNQSVDSEVRRGWFPSNYCRPQPILPPIRTDFSQGPRGRAQSHAVPSPNVMHDKNPVFQDNGVTDSILNAVILLRNAVTAGRTSHYQPSTACIISSIRSVLSATDCLTRESMVLKRYPELAKERKEILSTLSNLVTQARKASAHILDDEMRKYEANVMLHLADTVLHIVRVFLTLAARVGIKAAGLGELDLALSPRSSSVPDAMSRREMLKAQSLANLRDNRKMSTASGESSELLGSPILNLPPNSAVRAHFSPDLSAPLTPAITSSTRFAIPGNEAPDSPSGMFSCAEICAIANQAHDALLSIIAAFIGHIHTHSRSSHSSSYAQLIDLTREIIDRIRELLSVVDAVLADKKLKLKRNLEYTRLENTREDLFLATTALVAAASIIVSPPAPNASEEQEKRELVRSVTSSLRCAGDCVESLETLIGKEDSAMSVFRVVSPRTPIDNRQASNYLEAGPTWQEETGVLDSLPNDGSQFSRRRKHTVSMLGRKAFGLTNMRNNFVEGGSLDEEGEVEDESLTYEEGDCSQSFSSAYENTAFAGEENSVESDNTSSLLSRRNVGHPLPLQLAQLNIQRPLSGYSSASTLKDAEKSNRTAYSQAMNRPTASSQASAASYSDNEPSPHGSSIYDTDGSRRPSLSTNATSPRDELNSPRWGEQMPSKGLYPPPMSRLNGSSESFKSTNSSITPSMNSSIDSRTWLLERDYQPREIRFNADGNVTGGTLKCLVERMTLHDATIDPAFSTTFFLTFRMFTSPHELLRFLGDRFEVRPPSDLHLSEEDLALWRTKKQTPVRLRVYNLIKTWLELHWRSGDTFVLDDLQDFLQGVMSAALPGPTHRLLELVQRRRMHSIPIRSRAMTRAGSNDYMLFAKKNEESSHMPSSAPGTAPSIIVSKSLMALLRTQSNPPMTEFDPLELARQITIMESKLFCEIQTDELLDTDFGKRNSENGCIKAMSALSTRMTGLVAETILSEQDAKKRTAIVKFFIKVADRFNTLQNYNALMAILAALNSSTISRLKKTWEGLSNKYRVLLDQLRKVIEHARNYAEYRATLRAAVPPCLPFLGLYLTDITFVQEGNPSHRPSPIDPGLQLINFDRYQKLAKIISDIERFQIPYTLTEIPELQSWLTQALRKVENGGDVAALYRRSLLVEPRQGNDHPSVENSTKKDLFGWK